MIVSAIPYIIMLIHMCTLVKGYVTMKDSTVMTKRLDNNKMIRKLGLSHQYNKRWLKLYQNYPYNTIERWTQDPHMIHHSYYDGMFKGKMEIVNAYIVEDDQIQIDTKNKEKWSLIFSNKNERDDWYQSIKKERSDLIEQLTKPSTSIFWRFSGEVQTRKLGIGHFWHTRFLDLERFTIQEQNFAKINRYDGLNHKGDFLVGSCQKEGEDKLIVHAMLDGGDWMFKFRDTQERDLWMRQIALLGGPEVHNLNRDRGIFISFQ